MKRTLHSLGTAAFLVALLAGSAPAAAQPPIWEPTYGAELTDLTGEDDSTIDVTLSFPFPYGGAGYTTVYVGTNGCIQLGSLGTDDDIDYDHWEYFEEFVDDAAPEICAFNSDLDLSTTGTIHFNDFGDRAAFTWNEIGTNANETALMTFQIQIYATGRIVLGYNGILDGEGEDLLDDLDEGIVVGITLSNGINPGPTDLSNGPFVAGGTTYQAWCYDVADSCGYSTLRVGQAPDKKGKLATPVPGAPTGSGATVPGPINTAFDLDQTNVIFEPLDVPVIQAIPTLDEAGLALLALAIGAAATFALRRR